MHQWHKPLCSCRQNRVHVLKSKSKAGHLHAKRWILNIVHKFTYLGSCISSTENDINTRLVNVWTVIGWLLVIWNSDLSDKIKCNYSWQGLCPYYDTDALYGRWQSLLSKRLAAMAQECYELYWTNPGSNTPENSSYIATYLLSLKPSELNE